jgi:hypothetical protein
MPKPEFFFYRVQSDPILLYGTPLQLAAHPQ